MRAPVCLMVLAFIAYRGPAFPQAVEARAGNDADRLEVGISFDGADADPRRIGNTVAGKVLISYRNAPPGASVYLTVHPLKDNALVTSEGVAILPIKLNMNLVANLQTDSDGGVFRIDRANYPAELLIPSSALETAAMKIWSSESAKTVSAAFGPQGLRLVLGFLASLGRGGDGHEQAFFSFMLPKLEHPYDAVLITPMLISYEADGQQRILFRSEQMHSLKINVTSD